MNNIIWNNTINLNNMAKTIDSAIRQIAILKSLEFSAKESDKKPCVIYLNDIIEPQIRKHVEAGKILDDKKAVIRDIIKSLQQYVSSDWSSVVLINFHKTPICELILTTYNESDAPVYINIYKYQICYSRLRNFIMSSKL